MEQEFVEIKAENLIVGEKYFDTNDEYAEEFELVEKGDGYLKFRSIGECFYIADDKGFVGFSIAPLGWFKKINK